MEGIVRRQTCRVMSSPRSGRLISLFSGGLLRLRFGLLLVAGLLGNLAAQVASSPSGKAPGFTAQSFQIEKRWEEQFRALPEPKRIHENMLRLAGAPHHVGSAYQRKNAEWLLERYKEWGWDARIEQFDVLFPTPKTRILELISPTSFHASLEEPALSGDPYTSEKSTQLPGYNIYSGEGDVTGPLVYVNYGMPADYDELARNNISVKGSIVIARYGGGWRGLKPKLAYEHGALGCIIYSDPADDGYVQGQVLPKGPMRPPGGIQRGSVADMTLYSGDPLTPGIGSVPGAKRLPIAEAQTLMRIPVLPIGYADAQPLLEALEGRVVPTSWRGGLPFTYRFGPGPAKVHLKLEFNWEQRPVLDVIATMRGSDEPDVWIVRGNHYDAWVNGANDPISGQSALLEEARSLGALAKKGWRPKRTIVYAAWDGEEPGLIGSTEWVETHAVDLTQRAAVYINSDETGRGIFGAGGSHSLEQLINDIAKEITDPETRATVWKRQQAAAVLQGGHRPARNRTTDAEALKRSNLPLEAVGSGSDFGPFLDHLGIASVSLGFGGEDQSGTYHSAYDTPWFEEHFGDTDKAYGKALAQIAGTLVMRMADADVLPYNFGPLAGTVRKYDAELQALAKSLHQDADTNKQNASLGLYGLVNDPRNPLSPPPALTPPPTIDFAPLDRSIAALEQAATRFDRVSDKLNTLPPEQRRAINAELTMAERKLLGADGLPRRPWVRHLLYAPGTYTGYGAKTIPGVREALEQGRYDEAKQQVLVVANAIAAEAAYIDQIAQNASKSGSR